LNISQIQLNTLETLRLHIRKLEVSDAAFIHTLVNTPNWIRYIGDKGIHSVEAAADYIYSILSHQQKHYWVVSYKADQIPIGILTFMQRDHLEYPDFGFAFLPSFTRQGYAYEGCVALLSQLFLCGAFHDVFAITLIHNTASIGLLQKLGFVKWNMIEVAGEQLYTFRLNIDNFNYSDK